MRTKVGMLVVISLVVLAGSAGPAFAETALDVASVTTSISYYEKSTGWSFTPTQDIVVTKLGNVFRIGTSLLMYDHSITIYNSSGTPLVSGTVIGYISAGWRDPLLVRENGYTYVDVSEQNVRLTAGQTYVIAAYWTRGLYTNWWDNDIQYAPEHSFSTLITPVRLDLWCTGQGMPVPVEEPPTSNTFLAPNFQFELANSAPVAGDITVGTDVGQAVTVNVLASAYDADGDPLTVTVGSASHGTAALNGTVVTYTPNSGFSGTDTFTYTVSDGQATATGLVTVTVSGVWVTLDIKPGSYPNSVNLGSNGVVPVAILSTASFDALTVDPETVSLGGAGVAVRGKGNRYMASGQDVNSDGWIDLVLHVETENLILDQLSGGYGTINGATYGGLSIIGVDEIIIVPE